MRIEGSVEKVLGAGATKSSKLILEEIDKPSNGRR